MSDIYSKLKKQKSIRRHEITFPVALKKVMVSPLTLGDDTDLRTMITNMDMYESILVELLYTHSDYDGTFLEFKQNISNYDKKMLLYAIHLGTYGNMGKEEITCSKCKGVYHNTIYTKDLEVTGDSWEKDMPFTDYRASHVIDIEDGIIKTFEFIYKLPTIQDNMDLLTLIDIDKVKVNMDKLGRLLDQPEELSLITSEIIITSYDDEEEKGDEDDTSTGRKLTTDRISDFKDIHMFISDFLDIEYEKQLSESYFTEFKKYEPKFNTTIVCPYCKNSTDVNIDVELALTRSFLRHNNRR